MGKEQSQPKETLHPDMRAYLKDTFTMLRFQQGMMSGGGTNDGRTMISTINEHSTGLIRAIINDDKYLYRRSQTPSELSSFQEFEAIVAKINKKDKRKPQGNLSAVHTALLIKLLALYEWEIKTPHRMYSSHEMIDTGRGTRLGRELLGALVDREEVIKQYETLDQSRIGISNYSEDLKRDIESLTNKPFRRII